MTNDEGGEIPRTDGGRDPAPEAGHSVLRALSRGGSIAPKVLLRDDSSGSAPLVRTRTNAGMQGAEGRYSVLGEIARGGVGVVYKGHDTDIGRDVAMKVLHERFLDNDEVIQRFVEEAQIGGQLQHPGIVPVYELGIRGESTPYFTMKLVKGRTLKVLLDDRRDPEESQRRFLGIFEAICQTMAYAHNRGVVHRDLKPANVMVGAFGEVQVVDWGLSKVMGATGDADSSRAAKPAGATVIATVRSGEEGTHSQAGSILGTPAYMPPEQARGDVENLDEKCDVFALGAILCEILTGKPPYLGADREVLFKAVRAEQGEARERLANCGGEPALVELALACLSPAPSGRPRDAGAVAKEISAHLTSVEERVRRATEEAAEANVREAEEKRRQKLALLLAASLGVTLLVGGGAWAWIRVEGSRRSAEATGQVEKALQKAADLRARAAADGGTEAWEVALAASRSARDLSSTGEVVPAIRERAETLFKEAEHEAFLARTAAELEAADAALVAALDAIRLDTLSPGDPDPEARRVEAFKSYGADPTSLPVPQVVARLMGSGRRDRFADALDEWAADRRAAGRPFEEFTTAAAALDQDHFRDRLRKRPGIEGLREMAAGAADLSPRNGQALARALLGAGDLDAALGVLEAVRRVHPGDLWTHVLAGEILLRFTPPRAREAVKSLTAALALRPLSRSIHARLGTALLVDGDPAGASMHLGRAVELEPGNPDAQMRLGELFLFRGEHQEAADSFRRASAGRPAWLPPRLGLVRALLRSGRFEEALREVRSAGSLPGGPAAGGELEREALRLSGLEGRLAGVLRGERSPQDAAEGRDLAGVAFSKSLFAASAELLEKAMEKDPSLAEDPSRDVRFDAAVAAALAGAGGGDAATLDGAARAAWRGKALDWLSRDLAAWTLLLNRDPVRSPPAVRRALSRWRVSSALAGIRDGEPIAGLPATEQAAIRSFWEEVEALAWRAR